MTEPAHPLPVHRQTGRRTFIHPARRRGEEPIERTRRQAGICMVALGVVLYFGCVSLMVGAASRSAVG